MNSEQALVRKILDGDLDAFRNLINKYQKLVAHIVYRLLSNSDDYEDICQEVFIKVYKNLSGFKFNSKLSTWVGKITYNTTINYLRKEKLPLYNDFSSDLDRNDKGMDRTDFLANYRSDDLNPLQKLENLNRANYIQKLIEELPVPYRTIITLYHLEQMSYQEIGNIMNLPEGTVKSYLFRGRQKLKELLVRELEGEEI